MADLPQEVKKRIEVAKLFYPLDRTAQRRWARLFASDFKKICSRFSDLAGEWEFESRSASDNTILWTDVKSKNSECMFCFVDDVTQLESISSIFDRIRQFRPVFTYAIVHQKKDGEGIYDIFRLSRFSYLEHCNRVKNP